MDPLALLINYLLNLASDATTAGAQALVAYLRDRKSRQLDELREVRDPKTLLARLREVAITVAHSARSSAAGFRQGPLLSLLCEPAFQSDLADWLSAWDLPEAEAPRQRIRGQMLYAMQAGGASADQTEAFAAHYFELVDGVVFEDPFLAHWRQSLCLHHLRERVEELCADARRSAGRYTREEKSEALRSYCEIALRMWDIIDLSGLPVGDVLTAVHAIPIRQLYVPLRVRLETDWVDDDESAAAQSPAAGRRSRRRPRPIGERLAKAQRLLILGEPGTGKTTMLRWITTAYLLNELDREARDRLPDVSTLPDRNWVPLLILCRDLDERCLSGALDDFLTAALGTCELLPEHRRATQSALWEAIAEGRVLLLADGLDEIGDPKLRARFCRQIERVGIVYPQLPIILTSRVIGYRDTPHRFGGAFERSTLAELTAGDKDEFAARWCRATPPFDRAEERTAALIRDLHSSERIERLTGNPMLLTTMALVRRSVGRLPNRRARLYGEAIKVLLNFNPQYDPIDPDEAMPQLAYLAYEMCERGVQRLPRAEVLELLGQMRQCHPENHEVHSHTPQAFLTALEARSGLLTRWIPAGYGPATIHYEFRHPTFQEYLAALALYEDWHPGLCGGGRLPDRVGPLAGVLTGKSRHRQLEVTENWREPLRLCASMCTSATSADSVLEAILTPGEGEEAARTALPRALLALSCLADEPHVTEAAAAGALRAFARALPQGDGPPVAAAEIRQTAGAVAGSRWGERLRYCLADAFVTTGGRASTAGLLCGLLPGPALSAGPSPDDATGRALWALTAAPLAGAAAWTPSDAQVSLLGQMLQETAGEAAAAALAIGAALASGAEPPTPRQEDVLYAALQRRDLPGRATRSLVELAARLRLPGALSPLLTCLADRDARTRLAAVTALEQLADPAAVQPLCGCLSDHDRRVSRAAAAALGRLGDAIAVAPLLMHLTNPESHLLQPAMGALEELGPVAVAPLAEMLQHRDANVRHAAADVLGEIGDVSVLPALRLRLRDSNRHVREAAAHAIRQVRQRTSPQSGIA